jgi:hypothetical protein
MLTIYQGLPLPSESRLGQSILLQYLPTAIVTLIEPLWVLVNRLYCMLQPLEELQRSKASAPRSINLNYSSLPPQLTILKALQARHWMLASLCAMALLANVLATSFAGLLFQNTLPISSGTSFSPPFEPKFVNMNNSSGPAEDYWDTGDREVKISGDYRGSIGEDLFLAVNSNYTRNTSLPSWADAKAMYLPFIGPDALKQGGLAQFQASTKYFRAEPNCRPLAFGEDYQLQVTLQNSTRFDKAEFQATVQDHNGKNVTCYPQSASNWGFYLPSTDLDCSLRKDWCKTSLEFVILLEASPNATQIERETCFSTVALGWSRRFELPQARNTFFMSCRPKLTIGTASVLVDSAGVLQQEATQLIAEADQSAQALDKYYTHGANNLIGRSNAFLFRSTLPAYHNDSFPNQLLHYFVNKAAGNLRLTNPNEPLPQFADVEGPMKIAYERLFAAWLGINRDSLFV